MSPSGRLYLREHPSADANKLQWVKIKDGDKTLLICDRVILVNVSWNDLNGQGYITSKTVTIDGAKYKFLQIPRNAPQLEMRGRVVRADGQTVHTSNQIGYGENFEFIVR